MVVEPMGRNPVTLSFDEIWILTNIQRPAVLTVVNVVAFALLLVPVIPVYAAQRMAGDATALR